MSLLLWLLLAAPPALPPTFVSPVDGATMVLVPAGQFRIGSDDFKVEQPVHTLNLPALYVDTYEVTNELYEKFVKATGFQAKGDWKQFAGPGKERLPVRGLNYEDCLAYARWAGKRLPTEAEWEKAARGTKELRYPWGAAFQPGSCNSAEAKLAQPKPVGSYPNDVSPCGAYDMAGNVTEMTGSAFNPYPLDKIVDQATLPESRRNRVMLRGGSYGTDAQGCRLTQRGTTKPYTAIPWVGFRCVMDPPEKPTSPSSGR